MTINFAFHKLVNFESEIESPYVVTKEYFLQIVNLQSKKIGQTKAHHIQTRYYFDDGDRYFLELVLPVKESLDGEVVLAIPVKNLNQPKFFTLKDLSQIKHQAITIVPHGYSHVALAIYKNDNLAKTPSGGQYQDMPAGKENILSEQEVIFQLAEAKKKWENRGESPEEFVLPYGLYNKQTIIINNKISAYKYLTTCDSAPDEGQALRPRFLIRNSLSPQETINNIWRGIQGQ